MCLSSCHLWSNLGWPDTKGLWEGLLNWELWVKSGTWQREGWWYQQTLLEAKSRFWNLLFLAFSVLAQSVLNWQSWEISSMHYSLEVAIKKSWSQLPTPTCCGDGLEIYGVSIVWAPAPSWVMGYIQWGELLPAPSSVTYSWHLCALS